MNEVNEILQVAQTWTWIKS